MRQTPFDEIAQLWGFGWQARLGRLLGVQRSTVGQWIRNGYIPARPHYEIENGCLIQRTCWLEKIETVTGGKVKRVALKRWMEAHAKVTTAA